MLAISHGHHYPFPLLSSNACSLIIINIIFMMSPLYTHMQILPSYISFSFVVKMRSKLGPEDWTRITQRAAEAAEAALQQGLFTELQRDTSPAGASRFRQASACLYLPTLVHTHSCGSAAAVVAAHATTAAAGFCAARFVVCKHDVNVTHCKLCQHLILNCC